MAKKKDKTTPPETALAATGGATNYDALVEAIASAHDQTQRQAVQAVNLALTLRNWLIGYHIFEYEQHGQDRAGYGEKLLPSLAKDLRRRIGKGFAKRYLEMFRQFYLRYPIAKSLISQFNLRLPVSPSVQIDKLEWQDDAYFSKLFLRLSWTHFIELMRIDDPLKRAFYELESMRNHWGTRELLRQIDSLLYERVGLSRDKEGVLKLAQEGQIADTPAAVIRDPYVFEFLGLPHGEQYSEAQLEKALLDHLQEFLLELGEGFCFVARQRRVTFDNEHYYIDLLLYNRRLKCLVAIDLMTGKFRHEYAGAMNFYLNYLKAEEMVEGENPPVGLVLCADKNETHVEYALGGLTNQVFVSQYLQHLPAKEDLENFVRRTRRQIESG